MDWPEGAAVLVEIAAAFGAAGGGAIAPAAPAAELMVAVDYRGARAGTAFVGVSAGAARALAAGMLDQPAAEAVDDATAAEAAFEFANMVAGNAVPLLYGAGAEIRLGSPRASRAPDEASAARASALVDGGRISLCVVEDA